MVEAFSELDLVRALERATDAATQAGNLLRSYLENSSLHSLRTRADQEAEVLIRDILTQGFPHWGFRAEEEPELNELVSTELPFWLVDPNDGTSAFLKGERGASVSIALIYKGHPVLGIVYAYAAPNGLGDFFSWAKDISPLKRNGVPVRPRWTQDWAQSTILISNSADRVSNAYQEVLSDDKRSTTQYRVAPGVAYRLALCAAGEGEVAISLASPRDFDFAGGHALLIGAGGTLIDEKGKEVTYLHQRPSRLGFAFGGECTLVKKAFKLDWTPVFEGLRSPQMTPFISPQAVSLCPNSTQLDHVQGLWWGWHLGWCLEQSGQEMSSSDKWRKAIREYGGDQKLILEARSLINDAKTLDESPRIMQLIDAIESMTDVQESIEPNTPINGAKWGMLLGRRSLPIKVVSAFLGWRNGTVAAMTEMAVWQPDGDKLIEELLTHIPSLKRSITAWETRIWETRK